MALDHSPVTNSSLREGQPDRPPIIDNLAARKGAAEFAHYSEAEFARILAFYQIEWQYEPRSFPLRWDAENRVLEYFTPDFYLPEFDLYVELTTLKQSLVTKKNRKLRRLRELYPQVNIKLFYGRDVRSLLSKYGVGRPAAATSGGTEGAKDDPK